MLKQSINFEKDDQIKQKVEKFQKNTKKNGSWKKSGGKVENVKKLKKW